MIGVNPLYLRRPRSINLCRCESRSK